MKRGQQEGRNLSCLCVLLKSERPGAVHPGVPRISGLKWPSQHSHLVGATWKALDANESAETTNIKVK